MIKVICDECKEEEDGFVIHKCEECIEKENVETISSLEEDFKTEVIFAVEEVIARADNWAQKETYKDFQFKEGEDMFQRGLKLGYAHALYVMCDYFELDYKYADHIEKIQWGE
jgi:hypothetical protein